MRSVLAAVAALGLLAGCDAMNYGERFIQVYEMAEPGDAETVAKDVAARLKQVSVLGIAEAEGDQRIRVTIRDSSLPETVSAALTRPGVFGLYPVRRLASDGVCPALVAPDERCLPDPTWGDALILERSPLLSNGDIAQAADDYDFNLDAVVSIDLTEPAAERLCAHTTENIGERLSIIVDDVILSTPVIQSAICGRQLRITGKFSSDEARAMAAALGSGAPLPKLYLIEETTP